MNFHPDFESSTLDFKEDLPAHDQILKTVVGFCNQYGGRIMIGVRNDRAITGIAEEKAERLLEYLHKMIYESCSPPIVPEIYTQRFSERLVLVVSVSPGGQKPYFIRSAGIQQGTYVRLGRSTMRADLDTIAELRRRTLGISFDMTPAFAANPENIDHDLVSEFLKHLPAGPGRTVSRQLLDSYHCTVREQNETFPTPAGLLLFSKNPQHWFPEALIIGSRFSGTSGREAIATRDFTGTLFNQFEEAYGFVLSHLNKSFSIKGKKRIETYDVPPVAVREALINMVVHRNYTLQGPCKIAVFDDRVEFFSPGGFPGPIDTANLGSGITYIRNTAIARIMREAGYIEKLGTGFITMIESCAEAGLPAPCVTEGANFVKCILYRTPRSAKSRADIKSQIHLLFSAAREIGVADVKRIAGVSRATAVRRLNALVKNGLVVRKGAGAATRYSRP